MRPKKKEARNKMEKGKDDNALLGCLTSLSQLSGLFRRLFLTIRRNRNFGKRREINRVAGFLNVFGKSEMGTQL
jgi:hypothetical protein